jgi:uncharacterized damage-inducible protein DinB
MDPRLAALRTTLELNSRLFLNCLADLDEAQGALRPSERTNSIAFIAAHLVDTRHFLARYVGLATDNPFAARLAGARGIADVADCPTLAESRAAWSALAGALDAHLEGVDAAALDRPSPQRFPVRDPSVLGGVTFLVQHEAYHIGQLALLRKYAGAPAMSYR